MTMLEIHKIIIIIIRSYLHALLTAVGRLYIKQRLMLTPNAKMSHNRDLDSAILSNISQHSCIMLSRVNIMSDDYCLQL